VAGSVAVDTDLLIDFLRGKGPGVHVVRALLAQQRLRLTAVTGFELRVGADFLDRQQHIMRIFRSRTLTLDLRSALQAGEIAAQLRRAGQPIGFADCLQAGICLRHQIPLATRNHKHFSRVPDLELADLDEFGTD
jgi:tRNA(fMet)-specific endonuclease VapC